MVGWSDGWEDTTGAKTLPWLPSPWRSCRGWTGGVPGFLERQRGLAGLTEGAARLSAAHSRKRTSGPLPPVSLALAPTPTPSLISRREEDAAVGGAADGSCPWIASIGGNRVGGSWCEGKGGAPRRRSGLKPELGTNVSSCFFFLSLSQTTDRPHES